jgi:hypothetical protein
MGKQRLCDCGSVADWAEIGSTWICVACRNRDVKKNLDEFENALGKLERTERALHLLKVDTLAITNLLNKLKAEVNKIKV